MSTARPPDRHPAPASATAPCTESPSHRWVTKSQHRTSQGVVSYHRCGCGRWRVHLTRAARPEQPPVAHTLAVTSA